MSISNEKPIGSFKRCHSSNEVKEHEISFVYEAKPASDSKRSFTWRDIIADNGRKKTFHWIDLETLKRPRSLLHSETLLEKIQAVKPADNVIAQYE